MSGLQIDLILVMFGAFAFGLRLGRGHIVRADLYIYVATGIGLLLVQTNLMAALQIVSVEMSGVVLLLGRCLAFGGASALLVMAARHRAINL